MDRHEELLSWAVGQDVKLNGIQPILIPGRGTGIVATREIKEGEVILVVPASVFRSLDQVPKAISKRLPRQTSIHALLATFLILDKTKRFSSYHAFFPILPSFASSIPLLWPPELHTFLPTPAKDILEKQQRELERDWTTISKAFPDMNYDQYLHSWLLVGTRSFYFETSTMNRFPHNDRLALPIADLFNHADVGCDASFSQQGYKFIADRVYHAGEEIYTSYGDHSNDFLLTEYGFVLPENRWDAVSLDDILLPRFTEQQKNDLRDKGFLGKYFLYQETGCCFRTQVALRMLCCTYEDWQQFADAESEGEASQGQVNVLLLQILNTYVEAIQQTLKDMEGTDIGETNQRELLAGRWKQIEIMVAQAIKHLHS
ncbi:SET domain-containing protein [Aaosphaeria arxii CBS 175.79]|uniref:SET domain-containing protein n=1 Tax=Aaosphaeria arxii CBS 175.79 TaxID=1450172 RepID=A0A6A5XDF0_9PLEO|nr:SET domain-containing protein [Aaosphaeria arxii CBS 175.79]KAF2010827.1 SET domain-containing protein [Aaosphaeria arxii CBS 175.79]